MEELLKNISAKDLEKLKMLLSIVPEDAKKEVVTLRFFTEEYGRMIKLNRSKSYYVSVCSSFKHLIEFFGYGKSIQTIGLKDVENFLTHLQQNITKTSSSSRGEGYRVYFRTLKAAFNKAKDWGYVKENYFTKIKLPKRQKLAPVFINSEQLSAINDHVKNEIVKDVVVFAFYTGMRLNEIVNLRWKNVDLNKRIITVGDDKFLTKGRNQRFIPICEETFSIVEKKKYKKIVPIRNDFVFCKSNGVRYTGDYISKIFKLACKAANLDNAIHFHSLRHSFASNLVQRGVPLYTIKELLGHSSISTTEIYSHLNMDSLREAIGKLNSPHPNLLPKGEGVKQPKIFQINSAEK
ncbi:MAG: tyrosine-type recombinase/integrase [Candidatus Doudnabacteria bacterium]